MPHIHTKPNQHDITVSAYIIRQVDGEWHCFVHLHKKLGQLMQIGGHIELDETPWQSLAHELLDEAGYDLADVSIVQPYPEIPRIRQAVVHPVPLITTTHYFGDDHYHSDQSYGLVAQNLPAHQPAAGESTDVRWVTLRDLEQLVKNGQAFGDTFDIYSFFLANLDTLTTVPAAAYSLAKPPSD